MVYTKGISADSDDIDAAGRMNNLQNGMIMRTSLHTLQSNLAYWIPTTEYPHLLDKLQIGEYVLLPLPYLPDILDYGPTFPSLSLSNKRDLTCIRSILSRH